jgi:hypothetical protein
MQDILQLRYPSFLISRLRRNHALEHATIHVLGQSFPQRTFVGRSDAGGFFIFGNVNAEALRSAIDEAMQRLSQGEWQLATHPNCGTNFITAGVLAGTASFLALFGSREQRWQDRLYRLPLAILLSVVAIILAQPLGLMLQQRLTTQAELGLLRVVSIRRLYRGKTILHRITTAD